MTNHSANISCTWHFINDDKEVIEELLAKINGYNPRNKTVDGSGSEGSDIRLRILDRDGSTILETSPTEGNTGTNIITYQLVIENGYVLCIQVSNDDFATLAEDCHAIPTPQFLFSDNTEETNGAVRIVFSEYGILSPDSAANAPMRAIFYVFDEAFSEGTIELIGSRSAINAIDEDNFLLVSGINQTTTIVTAFGNVTVNESYNSAFEIGQIMYANLEVVDADDFVSAQPFFGSTNNINYDDFSFLADEAGVEIVWYNFNNQ